jgi:hypothetical protein
MNWKPFSQNLATEIYCGIVWMKVLYQQSLIVEELERLNRIEDKLMFLEEKFDLDQMSSDVEATPTSSALTEETPLAQPVGE